LRENNTTLFSSAKSEWIRYREARRCV